ncbi:MAG: inositol monophosphatase [Clostridia bacterium]|nr:inositol monophosphatase [Clostridia bacterium]
MTLRDKAILAEKAARAAGEMLLSHPHTPAKHKSENDFVTEMDLASERLIKSILLGACPEDGFFGEEEGGSETAPGRWIVDPIDGTSNFFKGNLLYTVSIAYELHGELVVGCVFCPPTGEMWLGVKGEGATLNGEPIHVSDTSIPRESFLHMSFCHRVPWANGYVMERLPAITRQYSDMRRTGSAAYDLCSIASGRCEGFFELCLHLYDVAAGVVILREAGGITTEWREDKDFRVTGHVLSSNQKIHEHLRGMLLSGDSSAILDEWEFGI